MTKYNTLYDQFVFVFCFFFFRRCSETLLLRKEEKIKTLERRQEEGKERAILNADQVAGTERFRKKIVLYCNCIDQYHKIKNKDMKQKNNNNKIKRSVGTCCS